MAPPKKRTAIGNRAPTNELGVILGGILSPAGMAPWTHFIDDEEFVPELMWPRSVRTYNVMRTDTQIDALYKATILGCMKFKWSLDPNGCPEEMVNKLSADYNLPIQGAKVNTRRRQKRRFKFKDHQRKAFYAGIYGHYYFEQVGTIEDDGYWHLKKLAERPPKTIDMFRVGTDGGLISIIQNIQGGIVMGPSMMLTLPEIPIDRLVGYVWEQEGANWVGRSWFRSCYKNWVIKDRLMRVDAINHERAGGVPYIEAHPGANWDEIQKLNQMAQKFRIGDTAGGAIPAGAKFNIARGTNSSVVDSIKYHDEAMARNWMLMVMQLGMTESGSRALGRTFIDFWGHGLASIADWFRDTFNEHVIEDDIDWNFGEDVDQVPLLVYEYDPEFVIQDLTGAIDSGAIETDDELEFYVRKEMGLPDKGKPRLNRALYKGTPQEPQVQESIQAPAGGGTSSGGSASRSGAAAGRGEDAPSHPDPAPIFNTSKGED